jgi:pimeloyl-ACP methyl ester carboxylesterase
MQATTQQEGTPGHREPIRGRGLERSAVVLLHSSGSSPRQWESLVAKLQPRFRPLAVELRGVDDEGLVGETLERLGGAHLVGHSYGGAVALLTASRRPGLVLSLAVYEPVLFRALMADPASAREAREILHVAGNIRGFLERKEPSRSAECFIDYWSGAGAWGHLSPGKQQSIAARMHEVLGHFDHLFDSPFDAPAIARIRRPILFMTGARTVASTRRLGALLQGALPGARHEVMPEMSHMGPVTHPGPVNERIEQFLAACEAEAGAGRLASAGGGQ